MKDYLIENEGKILRRMIDEVRDYAIFLLDRQGRVSTWNAGARSIFGFAPEEIIGKLGAIVFTPEDRASGQPEKEMETALKEGRAEDERWHIRKNGERFYASGVMTVVYSEDGQFAGFAKIARDKTQQKITEDRLKEANEELHRSSRLKSEFNSIVSHELRTPLSALKEAVSIMLEELEGPVNQSQRELLMIMRNSVDRLGRLINNVLDLAQVESGKFEMHFQPADLSQLIAESCSLMKMAVRNKKISLDCEHRERVALECDPDKIKQVIINLVDNAIKFTPPDGKIILRASDLSRHALLEVVDTGAGIKAEDQKRIFEMFEKSAQSTGLTKAGSGIGLAVCKKIVEQHQGQIRVESEYGKGAKFTVTLPKKPMPVT